jgi:hypothetical protein
MSAGLDRRALERPLPSIIRPEGEAMQIAELIHGLPAGVLPRCYYVLIGGKLVSSAHEDLGMRHPTSIYAVSLATIEERASAMLGRITPLYGGPQALQKDRREWNSGIPDSVRAFLNALMEHFDDCENILKCYQDRAPAETRSSILRLVRKRWRPYRDHVATIVNAIKHRQRRVRVIMFHNRTWGVPGYFIEGPAGGRTIGPDPKVHPGGRTAFSFRRDMAYHLCGLYAVSFAMADGLSKVDSRFTLAARTRATEKLEERWTSLIRQMESLNPLVFPDEMRKPFPRVNITGDKLVVQYPAVKPTISSVPKAARVLTSHTIDGMSPRFRPPYFRYKE